MAREVFPALIEKRDGGMPALSAGEKLRRFSAENVAQISLPDHERGVVESIEPMAIRTASGQFEPIDLALKDEGSSFTPTASQVAVQISKHLGGGVRAPGSGVSLTPADGKGEALGGSEGSVDGASVLYANTQTDTDTLAKPTSRGLELSAILRSEASPHDLYYRGITRGKAPERQEVNSTRAMDVPQNIGIKHGYSHVRGMGLRTRRRGTRRHWMGTSTSVKKAWGNRTRPLTSLMIANAVAVCTVTFCQRWGR